MQDVVWCAKAIRKELKAKFPTIKFSVRSEKYSGGTAVDIYRMGEIEKDVVREVVIKYAYWSFDGRNDIYNNDNVQDLPQAKFVLVH